MEQIYKCILCNQIVDEEELPTHLLVHLEGKLCTCDSCVKGFCTEKGLIKHLLRHLGNILHLVNEGDASYHSRNRPRAAHVNGASRKRQATRDSIERKRPRRKTPDDSKPWKCATCAQTFPTAEAVTQHLQTHKGIESEEKFKSAIKLQVRNKMTYCEYCGEDFQEAEELSDHKKSKCKICGATFICTKHLKIHRYAHAGDIPHKCETCASVFSNKEALEKHQQTSHKQVHICLDCGGLYSSIPSLQKHQDLYHRERNVVDVSNIAAFPLDGLGRKVNPSWTKPGSVPLTCTICNQTFFTAEAMTKHLANQHENPDIYVFQCTRCHRKFETQTEFHEHMIIHSETQCSSCDEQFESKNELQAHKRRTRPIFHKCNYCGEGFKKEQQLRNHRKSKCKICGATFICEKHLKIHTAAHAGDIPHKCETCGSVFSNKEALEEHQQTAHKQVHQCPDCGGLYSSIPGLQKHQSRFHRKQKVKPALADASDSQTGAQEEYVQNEGSFSLDRLGRRRNLSRAKDNSDPWTCAVCNKRFLTAEAVTKHLATQHKTAKVYQCTRCKGKFETKTELHDHMMTHTLMIPKCTICGEIFKSEGERFKHRNATCEICETSFICESHLKIHEATHVGGVPHKCEVCDRVFTHKEVLEQHKATYHKEVIMCKYCGKIYACLGNLQNHITLGHRGVGGTSCNDTVGEPVKDPYICVVCGAEFEMKIKLEAHTLTHEFKL